MYKKKTSFISVCISIGKKMVLNFSEIVAIFLLQQNLGDL